MQVIKTRSELGIALDKFRVQGRTIGFVPTMGALHSGHMSLVDIARQNADIVVVSIFVNPTQFAPNEDFDAYPRTIDEDLQKLEGQGVEVVYLPEKEEIYPDGFNKKISIGEIGKQLEGVTRPHFFDGVALVVSQLFARVQPEIAVFGEKDFQQLNVIRKLVSDLGLKIKIIGASVIRERDGLAMSSRNVYLTSDEREIACGLYKTLMDVAQKITDGESVEESIIWGKDNLIKQGFSKVDYLELRDAGSLLPVNSSPARLLAAVYLGNVRLIDNIEVPLYF